MYSKERKLTKASLRYMKLRVGKGSREGEGRASESDSFILEFETKPDQDKVNINNRLAILHCSRSF